MSKTTTNRKMVTVAMLVAILLVAIDVTVVSTAMPQIVSDLSGLKLISTNEVSPAAIRGVGRSMRIQSSGGPLTSTL